jgi:hypothetical protein
MKHKNFSVQYHPEASPGPHDSSYLFDQFIENIKGYGGCFFDKYYRFISFIKVSILLHDIKKNSLLQF